MAWAENVLDLGEIENVNYDRDRIRYKKVDYDCNRIRYKMG